MKNEVEDEKDKQVEDPIVIADECGDSMWDAVLGQEIRACQIAKAIDNPEKLLNKIETEQSVENDYSRK